MTILYLIKNIQNTNSNNSITTDMTFDVYTSFEIMMQNSSKKLLIFDKDIYHIFHDNITKIRRRLTAQDFVIKKQLNSR